MGLLSIGADTVYTYRFIKLLVTPFEKTEAYKLGLIDKDGKRIKGKKVENTKERSAYSPFHRLVFNIKKMLAKLPGRPVYANLATALFLMKEQKNISEKSINRILASVDAEPMEAIEEATGWFILEDGTMAPGIYKLLSGDKLEPYGWKEIGSVGDRVKVNKNTHPIGEIFGRSVYECTHIKTNKVLYITANEVKR